MRFAAELPDQRWQADLTTGRWPTSSQIVLLTSGRARMPLIAREDSLLVVVDLQPRFWGDRLDADDRRRAREVAARAAWLAGGARAPGGPAGITEEEAGRNGPTCPGAPATPAP